MGNQQERTLGLPFVAGLIVGEGCFQLTVNRIRGTFRILPRLRVVMDDHRSLRIAESILKEHGLSPYMYERQKGKSLCLEFSSYGKLAKVLEQILPLLTGTKRDAAEVVKRFVDSRYSLPRASQYTDAELAMVEEIRAINGGNKGSRWNSVILRDYTPDTAS